MTKAPAKKAKKEDAIPEGKSIDPPKAGHKPNALQQKLQPSDDLAAVVGDEALARGEAVSKVWEYVKLHKLQDPDDGRQINADDKLEKVFGKKSVTMFEMNKILSEHLSSVDE